MSYLVSKGKFFFLAGISGLATASTGDILASVSWSGFVSAVVR
jgi:hypothetical protein